MILDVSIILAYFTAIMAIGVRARVRKDVGAEEYFLSARSLKWPSIAMSTIATNIQANHFIGMAGSAYLYGLAQANLEINAIFGILVAAFFFVPLYLRMKVLTITQFFEAKLGPQVALAYSVLMIVLYSLLYLGTALFWAAYAIDGIFSNQMAVLTSDPVVRLGILIVATGVFSAVYTYLGGLRAVVRTDIVQLVLLVVGGLITLSAAIHHLGGWSSLWTSTGDLMHLHLPRDHETLPWVGLFGMFLLNLNYWGANQIILQRALAAKNLRHAQIGLLVGGALKYLMVLIIIVPGIALAGILRENPLDDPDLAYLTLVNMLLPAGVRGLILCGLFASLMSTLDSIYNSVSTLYSIDIYKRYLKPDASEYQVVRAGKRAIIATLITGVLFSFVVIYVKYGNPQFPLTHWFNELSYYVKNGFVLLVMAAVFLVNPSKRLVLATFLSSVAVTYLMNELFGEMNYFVRSGWVIVLTFAMVAIPTVLRNGWRLPLKELLLLSSRSAVRFGTALLGSLILCHLIFH
ncbi:sodium/solute symporter [Acidobacteria bacterium AH-259-D05]|nr:sodium/solute symporter [Acidobacteria bacterium AH-259-D05]